MPPEAAQSGVVPGPNRIKQRVFEILVEPPEGDKVATAISFSILVLIALNVIVCVVETHPELAPAFPNFFYYFEMLSVAIFTVEYIARLWAITIDEKYQGALRGRLKAAREPMAIVDLLAIAPFFLQILLPGLDLRFVRALRLFRIFRVFKVGRYAQSFGVLVRVVKSRREELLVATVIVIIAVVLSASIMYLCEHEAQPDDFRSVPHAMWWAIITITTIGYGDVAPITPIGRIFGGIVGYMGICIFALPVGILGGAFIEEMERQRLEKLTVRKSEGVTETRPPGPRIHCPHCGEGICFDLRVPSSASSRDESLEDDGSAKV